MRENSYFVISWEGEYWVAEDKSFHWDITKATHYENQKSAIVAVNNYYDTDNTNEEIYYIKKYNRYGEFIRGIEINGIEIKNNVV